MGRKYVDFLPNRGEIHMYFFRSGSLSSSSGVDVGRRDSTHRSERSSSMLHNPFQVLRRRRPRELKNPTHRSERTSSALFMKRRGTSLKIPCLWQFSPSHPTMPVKEKHIGSISKQRTRSLGEKGATRPQCPSCHEKTTNRRLNKCN